MVNLQEIEAMIYTIQEPSQGYNNKEDFHSQWKFLWLHDEGSLVQHPGVTPMELEETRFTHTTRHPVFITLTYQTFLYPMVTFQNIFAGIHLQIDKVSGNYHQFVDGLFYHRFVSTRGDLQSCM